MRSHKLFFMIKGRRDETRQGVDTDTLQRKMFNFRCLTSAISVIETPTVWPIVGETVEDDIEDGSNGVRGSGVDRGISDEAILPRGHPVSGDI